MTRNGGKTCHGKGKHLAGGWKITEDAYYVCLSFLIEPLDDAVSFEGSVLSTKGSSRGLYNL